MPRNELYLQPAAVIIFSSGRMSVVNAEERASRDFIATGCCTKHEKRENLHNAWGDLESKVQLQFKSVEKKMQFNSIVRKETKSFLHLHKFQLTVSSLPNTV